MRALRHLAIFTILAGCLAALPPFHSTAAGQNPPISTVQLAMPVNTLTPSPVSQASLQRIGNPGAQTYFYWFVAVYPVGKSSISGPYPVTNLPGTLDGSNYVAAYPVLPAGATSIDELRTATPIPPTGACNCAVATAQTSFPINDQSNSLNSYTVTAADLTTLGLTLDNEVQGSGLSHLILRQNGVLVCDISMGCGSSTPGTVTSIGLGIPAGFVLTNSPITTSGTINWAMPAGWTTGSILIGSGSGSVANLAFIGNGNCLGGTGGTIGSVPCGTITGSGTNGHLTGWTGSGSLGNVDLAGDTTTSGGLATTTFKVNGVAFPASPSVHQVPVVTGSNAVTWKTIPDCPNTGGNHLNYTQSTDAWSCGTSGGGGGNVNSSGTPLVSQVALWVDATHVQGVTGFISDASGNVVSTSITSPLTCLAVDTCATRESAGIWDLGNGTPLDVSGALQLALLRATTVNALGGFQVSGVALASTNLSDSSSIVRYNLPGTFLATQNLGTVFQINGTASGTATIQAPAAVGSNVYLLPTVGGTFAISASSPLALDAGTGNLTFTGPLSVALGGTGLASGTSGGVLAYTASGTLASSGALTANLPVIGGGAGAAPTVGARQGNTTKFFTTTGSFTSGNAVASDSSGNAVDAGFPLQNSILTGMCNGTIGATSGTGYDLFPYNTSAGTGCNSSAAQEMPMPFACTAKNMQATVLTAATTSVTFTLFKGGVSQALSAACGTGLTCSDTTHTVSFAAGNLYSIRALPGQNTETAATFRVSFQCE